MCIRVNPQGVRDSVFRGLMTLSDGTISNRIVFGSSHNTTSTVTYFDNNNGIENFTKILTDGKWIDLTLTKDGDDMILYFDGAIVDTMTLPTPSITGTFDRLTIGNTVAVGELYKGLWTDAKLFSQILTPSEVADLHFTGQNPYTPVVEYRCTEGSGSTVADSSGNGLDGTITTATWSTDTPSKRRKSVQNMPYSLLYDGSGDYTSTPYTASMQITDTFTCFGWVKLNDKSSANAYSGVFGCRGAAGTQWMLYWDKTGQEYRLNLNTSSNQFLFTGSKINPIDGWHFMSVRKTGTSVVLNIDEAKYTATCSGATINAINQAFVTGVLDGVVPTIWNLPGNITRLRYYNTYLTDSEIADAQFDGVYPTSGLILGYDYTAGSGSTLTDVSGNGNNATITSATWSTDTPSKARSNISVARSNISVARTDV